MKTSGADQRIKVQKKNLDGDVTYAYEGVLLARNSHSLIVEAFFDRDDMSFQGVILKKGDRFVEYYYSDHWFNIFEIYDRDDGKLKGWYCNVSMPAVFEDDVISYVDLALDLWISVDGKQIVLDEDEFEELSLSDEFRRNALNGLNELKLYFDEKKPPS